MDLVDYHSLDTEPEANSFLANTEIVEDKGPFYKPHAVAYEVMADQDILALVVVRCFVVRDLSFVPLTARPDLNPDLIVVADPVSVEFLVANDCSKVSEALANFVLYKQRMKNRNRRKLLSEIKINFYCIIALTLFKLFNEQLKMILIRELHAITSLYLLFNSIIARGTKRESTTKTSK